MANGSPPPGNTRGDSGFIIIIKSYLSPPLPLPLPLPIMAVLGLIIPSAVPVPHLGVDEVSAPSSLGVWSSIAVRAVTGGEMR